MLGPSLTAPQKQYQPGTPDESDEDLGCPPLSSPLASASRTVREKKYARSGPSGRHVKGTPEIRSPSLVFVRKVRGGVPAKDATHIFFSFFRILGGKSAPKSPWRPAKCPQKNRKKKFKARPKCGLPPWFSCARSAAEFPRTMRRPFFFFLLPPRFRLTYR